MISSFTTLFERWTAGERTPSLYAYSAFAAPASALYRLGLSVRPHLSRQYPALSNSRLAVVSSPLVGGVGKTPLTALLARGTSESGNRPAIVTMGYGRKSAGVAELQSAVSGIPANEVGDEAAELFLTTGCPVSVGDEPAEVINRLDNEGAHDWIIFDDGVSRTWQGEKRVVVFGDTDLVKPVRYLPIGRWRTKPSFVRTASYVAITSTNDVETSDFHRERLNAWGYRGPIGWFKYQMIGIEPYSPGSVGAPPVGRPFAFCGIARPDRFLQSVRALGYDDSASCAVADHHHYTEGDLAGFEISRKKLGCDWFLTTLKDAVKIDPAWIGSTPLYFLRIALHQVAGPDILTELTKDD